MNEKAFVKLAGILRDNCDSANDINVLLVWLQRQYITRLVEEKIMAVIDNVGIKTSPDNNTPEDILPKFLLLNKKD